MILEKMVSKKLKQVLFYGAGIVLIILFFSTQTEASRRKNLTDQDIIDEMIINHRKIDLKGNLFDMYINNDTEIITIQGEIEVYDKVDWNEVQKIKDYFYKDNPGNYEFIFKFKFMYKS